MELLKNNSAILPRVRLLEKEDYTPKTDFITSV